MLEGVTMLIACCYLDEGKIPLTSRFTDFVLLTTLFGIISEKVILLTGLFMVVRAMGEPRAA